CLAEEDVDPGVGQHPAEGAVLEASVGERRGEVGAVAVFQGGQASGDPVAGGGGGTGEGPRPAGPARPAPGAPGGGGRGGAGGGRGGRVAAGGAVAAAAG